MRKNSLRELRQCQSTNERSLRHKNLKKKKQQNGEMENPTKIVSDSLGQNYLNRFVHRLSFVHVLFEKGNDVVSLVDEQQQVGQIILNQFSDPELLLNARYLKFELQHNLGIDPTLIELMLLKLTSAGKVEPALSSKSNSVFGNRITKRGINSTKLRKSVVDQRNGKADNQQTKNGKPGCTTTQATLSSTNQALNNQGNSTMSVSAKEILSGLELVIISQLDHEESVVSRILETVNAHEQWSEMNRQSVYERLLRLQKLKFVKTKPIGKRRVSYKITEPGRKALRKSRTFYRSV